MDLFQLTTNPGSLYDSRKCSSDFDTYKWEVGKLEPKSDVRSQSEVKSQWYLKSQSDRSDRSSKSPRVREPSKSTLDFMGYNAIKEDATSNGSSTSNLSVSGVGSSASGTGSATTDSGTASAKGSSTASGTNNSGSFSTSTNSEAKDEEGKVQDDPNLFYHHALSTHEGFPMREYVSKPKPKSIQLVRELTDDGQMRWYHATFYSNLASIMKNGLLSKKDLERKETEEELHEKFGMVSEEKDQEDHERDQQQESLRLSDGDMCPVWESSAPIQDPSKIFISSQREFIEGLSRRPDVLIEINAEDLKPSEIEQSREQTLSPLEDYYEYNGEIRDIIANSEYSQPSHQENSQLGNAIGQNSRASLLSRQAVSNRTASECSLESMTLTDGEKSIGENLYDRGRRGIEPFDADRRNIKSDKAIKPSKRTLAVSGRIPISSFHNVVPVMPGDLPDDLKASIVNPYDFDSIPLLDFGVLRLKNNEYNPKILKQLEKAAKQVGFFSIINHSVPTDLMDRMLEKSKAFFALPESVKKQYQMESDGPLVGYFGKGMENLDDVTHQEDESGDATKGDDISTNPSVKLKEKPKKLDCKEGFDMQGSVYAKKQLAQEDGKLTRSESTMQTNSHGSDSNGQKSLYTSNSTASSTRTASVRSKEKLRWTRNCEMPDKHVKEFSDVMKEYQTHAMQLGLQIMDLIGKLLGKNGHLVRESCDDAVCHHRILHYPPLQDYHREVSIGAHVDYGFLTLLIQDMVGGLQVLNNKSQRWIHVPPIKHAYVVNFGSMLQAWTNNRIKATVHRVVNLSTSERFSSPYFFRPSLDTLLDPHVFQNDDFGNYETNQAVVVDDKKQPKQKPMTCEEVLASFYTRANLIKKN